MTQSTPGEGSTDTSSTSRKRSRAAVACTRCKKSKLKCSGSHPCQRCTDNNAECEYEVPVPTFEPTILQRQEKRISTLEAGLAKMESFLSNNSESPSSLVGESSVKQIIEEPNNDPAPAPSGVPFGEFLVQATAQTSQTHKAFVANRLTDNPLDLRIITAEQADTLLNHAFMHARVLQLCPPERLTLEICRSMYPFFLTLTLASAASQYRDRTTGGLIISEEARSAMVHLAERHLGDSLTCGMHNLWDVAAVIYFAGSTVRKGVCGKQQWQLFNHAMGICELLGVFSVPIQVRTRMTHNETMSDNQAHAYWLSIELFTRIRQSASAFGLPDMLDGLTNKLLPDTMDAAFAKYMYQRFVPNSPIDNSITQTLGLFRLAVISAPGEADIGDLTARIKSNNGNVVATTQALINVVLSIHKQLDHFYQDRLTSVQQNNVAFHNRSNAALLHRWHYWNLHLAGKILSIYRHVRDVVDQEMLSFIHTTLERLQASAFWIVDNSALLLSDGNFYAEDDFAIAIVQALAYLNTLAATHRRGHSTTSDMLLDPVLASLYIDKGARFLESVDCSALRFLTALARVARHLATHSGLSSSSEPAHSDENNSANFADVTSMFDESMFAQLFGSGDAIDWSTFSF